MNRIKFGIIDRLEGLYVNVYRTMESVFETYLGGPQDGTFGDPEDIPKTNEPVWILGKKYSAILGEFNFQCNLVLIIKKN